MRIIITFGFLVSLITNLYSQHDTGLIFSNDEDYNKLDEATAPSMGTLPSSVDLSEWFPVPEDQRNQASCVGWAVAYGLKSYQEAIERGVKPLNATNTFSA